MGAELKRLIGQLLQQISVSEFRDENGHLLTKFKAYDDLVKYVQKDMGHPKDNEVLTVQARVEITHGRHSGKKATITGHNWLKDGKNFLNYWGSIDGMKGRFALYHDDLKPISPSSPQPS